MENYITVKAIKAEEAEKDGVKGYKVQYPDGYVSFCPKDVFERNALLAGADTNGDHCLTDEVVSGFARNFAREKVGRKTAVVTATLRNGFEVTESSACVREEDYDETYGAKLAEKKIEEKVWELLGFLLQSALNGFK